MQLHILIITIILCWSSVLATSEPDRSSTAIGGIVSSIFGGSTTTRCRSYTSSTQGCTSCSYCTGSYQECCFNGYCYNCQSKISITTYPGGIGGNYVTRRCTRYTATTAYGCTHRCGNSWGCSANEVCCNTGNCNRCESRYDTGGHGGSGGYPSCISSTNYGLALYVRECYDSCGLTQQCGRGERCCWNGKCRKCEAHTSPTIYPPHQNLPKCRAYSYTGASTGYGSYCKNECTAYSGCGTIERCCWDGRCNKCELKYIGTGGGLDPCVSPPHSFAYTLVGCRDTCTNAYDCGSGYKCCFNKYCRKCEAYGGGGGSVPSCYQYSSSSASASASVSASHTSPVYCRNECYKQSDCSSLYQRCCNDGRCNKCVSYIG